MQHPEAAGMTVAQRDAILNAKTAPQAAALIDQYYERSSGRDRQVRMSAASAFASGGGPAPASATGPATPPPAGYHVLVPGSTSPDQYRTLTTTEVEQRGLDTTQQYQLNTKTGALTGLGKAGSAAPPGNPDLSGPTIYPTSGNRTRHWRRRFRACSIRALPTRPLPPDRRRLSSFAPLCFRPTQAMTSKPMRAGRRRFSNTRRATRRAWTVDAKRRHAHQSHVRLGKAARDLPDHSTAGAERAFVMVCQQTNAPWLIKFNEGRKFVASELPKFLKGKAPTEGQVREHYESYSPSKGKTGIQTALATDVDYLYGRYQPLIQAYKDNTGKDLNIDDYAPGQADRRAKAAALEYYRAERRIAGCRDQPRTGRQAAARLRLRDA
jgi:hypothetical protein